MGAEQFVVSGYGKTANEAFAAARDEALYESGHGGYTGTIAEKGDFVLIRPTAADYKAALAYVVGPLKERVERARKSVEALTAAKAAGQTHAYTLDQFGYEGQVSINQLPALEGQLAKAEESLAKYSKPDAKVSASAMADYYLEKRDSRIDDKWGPAGCLVITEPVVSNIKRISEDKLIALAKMKYGEEWTYTVAKVKGGMELLVYKDVPARAYGSGYGFGRSPATKEIKVRLHGKKLADIANSFSQSKGKYLFFGWASS